MNNYNYKSLMIRSKKKLVMYTKVLIEIQKQRNYRLTHKTYKIAKIENTLF